MNTQKLILFLSFCLTTMIAQAQITDKISIRPTDVQLTKTQEFNKIHWKSDYTISNEGEPEIPFHRVSYVLPIDAKVTGVTFQSAEKQLLRRDIYVYPSQPSLFVGYTEDVNFVQPNTKVYNSDAPYPGKLYEIESDDIIQGYHVVTLRIYPFEYIPKSQLLNYYPDLEYIVEYESGTNTNVIQTETQSVLRADLCKKFIKQWVQNSSDIEKFGSSTRSLSNGRTIVQRSSSG